MVYGACCSVLMASKSDYTSSENLTACANCPNISSSTLFESSISLGIPEQQCEVQYKITTLPVKMFGLGQKVLFCQNDSSMRGSF